MQVSIIIPVYNCEKYILECLDSVCGQTLHSIEVICVDDGSTDQSFFRIKEYSKLDKRVKVVRQQNQGAGVARNFGLQLATGEYVAFLDADDFYYEKSALETLFNACVQNSVKACGSGLKLLRNGSIADDVTLREIKEAAQKATVLKYQDFQFDYGYTGFLFQRKMLIENNIFFPQYRRFQDPPFLVQAMYIAEKFAFKDTALYCYRVPIMAARFSKEKIEDLLKGLRDNLLFAHKHELKKLFHVTLMRVEYEYYSIICRLVDRTDRVKIQLLEEIQNIASIELQQENYTLRVLQFLDQNNENYFEHYEENMIAELSKETKFYLYGAGGLAKKFLKFLERNELLQNLQNIIVSQKAEEKEYIGEKEVRAIDELSDVNRVPVYLATGAIFHHEIVKELQARNVKKYHIIDSVFLEELEV